MRGILCAAALLAATIGTAAAGLSDPPPPRGGGPCEAGAGPWMGTFSGRRIDPLNDWVWPVSARACFPSEYLCRRWVSEVQTWADLPGLMRCERIGR